MQEFCCDGGVQVERGEGRLLEAFKILDQGNDVLVARPGGVVQRDEEEQVDAVEARHTGKRNVDGGGVHGIAGRFTDVGDDFTEREK